MQVYGASKVYLIMASKAVNERLEGTEVEVFATHPGKACLHQFCQHGKHMIAIGLGRGGGYVTDWGGGMRLPHDSGSGDL